MRKHVQSLPGGASTGVHVAASRALCPRAPPSLVCCCLTTAFSAQGFVSFTFGRVPVLWIFFSLKDIGFFREIHLWLFKVTKQVNCILVNNLYQKTLLLISKNPAACISRTYFSLIMMTFLWKEQFKVRGFLNSFVLSVLEEIFKKL